MSATIIADDREREVIPLLSEVETATVDVIVRRLCVGDYAVAVRGRLAVVIERKTLQDLAASMRDGRMESQCAKLRELEAADHHPPRILFLIEGPSSSSSSHGGIPFTSLQAKVDSLMIGRDRFGILWTRDPPHTAKRLVALAQTAIGCCCSAVEEEGCVNPLVEEVVEALQQQTPTDDAAVRVAMLCQLRGVSKTTAKAILREHPISAILLGKVSEKVLASTRYHHDVSSTTTIGMARAAHIVSQGRELSNISPARPRDTPQHDLGSQILMKVHGVSRAVAGGILNAVSFEDLVNDSYDATAIAKCPRAGSKRCIGPAVLRTLRQCML